MTTIRSRLIDGGVRNLHEFGYGAASAENILTDQVYRAFFGSMLESNKGHGAEFDKEIDALLAELAKEPQA